MTPLTQETLAELKRKAVGYEAVGHVGMPIRIELVLALVEEVERLRWLENVGEVRKRHMKLRAAAKEAAEALEFSKDARFVHDVCTCRNCAALAKLREALGEGSCLHGWITPEMSWTRCSLCGALPVQQGSGG